MNDSLSIIGKSAQRCYESGGETITVRVLYLLCNNNYQDKVIGANGFKKVFKKDPNHNN